MANISELSKYIQASTLVTILTEKDREFYLAMLNEDKDNFLKTITSLGIAKSHASVASSGGGGSSASSGGSTRCLGDRCGGHGFIKRNGCCDPCLASMEAADRAKERAAASPSSGGGGGIRSSIPPPAERVIIEHGVDRGMYVEFPRQHNMLEAALYERQRAETIAKYGGIPGEIRYHNGPSPFGPGVHVVHHGAAGMFVQRNPGVHGGGGGFPFGVAQINGRLFNLR